MKKLLFLVLLGTMTMSASKSDINSTIEKTINKNTEKLSKGTSTVYGDAKDLTSTLYGDAKDGTKTAYSDAKSVIKYLTPEAKSLVIKIAQKLEKTTDQVWDILVRQQKVWSWCYLLLTISAFGLWIRFYIQFHITKTDLNESNELKEINVTLAVVLFAMAIIASSYSSYYFADMITGFMNPEYGAMKNLYQVYKAL